MRHILAFKNYKADCVTCGHEFTIPLLVGSVIQCSDDKMTLLINPISQHYCNNCLLAFDLFSVRLSGINVTNEFNTLFVRKDKNA